MHPSQLKKLWDLQVKICLPVLMPPFSLQSLQVQFELAPLFYFSNAHALVIPHLGSIEPGIQVSEISTVAAYSFSSWSDSDL